MVGAMGEKGANSAHSAGRVPQQEPVRPKRHKRSGLHYKPMALSCIGGLLTSFCLVSVGVLNPPPTEAVSSSTQERGGRLSLTLREVAPVDHAAAVETFNPYFRSLLGDAGDHCPAPLAEVTVLVPAGASTGLIQIRSGSYVSPPFQVTHTPQRIAIPFPAEYSVGRGAISVLGTTDAVSLALDPVWYVTPLVGTAERQVVWTPRKAC